MEAKKRYHPNFFDILIVAVILLLAAGAWFISHRGDAVAKTMPRTYVLEVSGLQSGMEAPIVPGCSVTDNIRNYDIGVVTAVEEVPSLSAVFDETSGTVRQTPTPNETTLLVTIQADTVESEKNVSTKSGYDLKVGKNVSCTIGGVICSGYILEVERKEAQDEAA